MWTVLQGRLLKIKLPEMKYSGLRHEVCTKNLQKPCCALPRETENSAGVPLLRPSSPKERTVGLSSGPAQSRAPFGFLERLARRTV